MSRLPEKRKERKRPETLVRKSDAEGKIDKRPVSLDPVRHDGDLLHQYDCGTERGSLLTLLGKAESNLADGNFTMKHREKNQAGD